MSDQENATLVPTLPARGEICVGAAGGALVEIVMGPAHGPLPFALVPLTYQLMAVPPGSDRAGVVHVPAVQIELEKVWSRTPPIHRR